MGIVISKTMIMLYGLSCLKTSKAYYSVYILCTMIGAMEVYACYQKKEYIQKREALAGLIFGFLFAGMITLGNYPIYTDLEDGYQKKVIFFGIFVGAVVTGYHMFLFLYRRMERCEDKRTTGRRKVFLLTFILSVLFVGIYWFYTGYPGNLSYDSINQLNQIQSGVYSDHHPFWHTMIIKLWYELGMMLFHEINAAVALYSFVQIICIAAVFSFAVMSLYEAGIPMWYVCGVAAVYIFSPYNHGLMIAMWKDILFSGSLLLLLIGLFRVFYHIGNITWNNFCIILGGVGFGLLRNNGWPVLLISAIIALLLLKKRVSILLIVCVFITGIMKWPVLKLLNVEKMDFTEAMSLPVQQIARVLWEGHDLTDEERDFLRNVSEDPDEIAGLYNPILSDPVRADFRTAGREYLKHHLWDYIRFWIKLGKEHPAEYIRAWIDQTNGYWNAGYKYWIFLTDVEYNELGIEHKTRSIPLEEFYSQYDSIYFQLTIFEPLRAIGLHAWLGLIALFIGILRKDWNRTFLAVPVVLTWVVLCFVTPVNSEFRYAYPIFTCMPIILGSALFTQKNTAIKSTCVVFAGRQ